MKKIAFIVQQYGLEMYGGAEFHCMRLAEKMASLYDVDVLTTCSLDYMSWANYYPEGVSIINGVTVRRFKVSQERNWERMTELEKKIRIEKHAAQQKGIKGLVKNLFWWLKDKKATDEDYMNWILAQGPTTLDLINHLKTHEGNYDCLIFFTYLYYPTVAGIDINPKKTIFIPLAHDEWPIYMPVFKTMFTIPACIMYNTMAEKKFVNRLFNNEAVYAEIAGTWVNMPVDLPDIDIKTELKIYTDYILFVGRIDSNKITDQDFEWFLKYVSETKKKIKLVLTGNLYREIPVSDDIVYLGFTDEHTKFNLIKKSLFLFQPSRFESLSIVLLEAFAMEKPVLVHQDCEVMKDHVDMSKGGFYYNDYAGFKDAFNQLTDNTLLNSAMGKLGKAYVDKNYRSENIIAKFQQVIEHIIPDKKINSTSDLNATVRKWNTSLINDFGKRRSELCKAKDYLADWYLRWCTEIGETPNFHRKQWEFVYILQALWERGCIVKSNRGLVFAVGSEPLPSVFAKFGCSITATDIFPEKGIEMGWAHGNQLCFGLESLNTRQLCDEEVFNKSVQYIPVDMNDIPADLIDFDFNWSSCSFEHLGSLEKGFQFLKNQLKTLKPGGWAVHTTEYNVSSNDETMEQTRTVIYRQRDIEYIVNELRKDGHFVEELDFSIGGLPEDYMVDVQPHEQKIHLKLQIDEYVATSIGLIIQKKK